MGTTPAYMLSRHGYLSVPRFGSCRIRFRLRIRRAVRSMRDIGGDAAYGAILLEDISQRIDPE
ncbi:MAG: hypothetical protein U1E27_04115 [Kiritimatiellia bacterium]|nr:hypothetical protein [Kiritimatiellia bacterium]